MNVLAIGNSFSEDATRYLHAIARADGEKLDVANLYIGGCSLERHYQNMLTGEAAYEQQYNGEKTGFHVSLEAALLNRDWDVITLQQVSQLAPREDSYEPYLNELAAYVRKCAPAAKLYIHQTWAYEDKSDRLLNVAGYESSELMRRDVVAAYAKAAETVGADGIIRSGEMLGALENAGITGIHRDTFHASLGIGRYALSLIWYRALTGRSVSHNTFRDFDAPINESLAETVRDIADTFY